MISLDEQYFAWLYSKAFPNPHREPILSYKYLTQQLYFKEFIWFIPNDDNRNEEGIELRKAFISENELETPHSSWLHMSSSILEVLLILSHHLSFLDERPVHVWFLELLENLDLSYANDDIYDAEVEEDVDHILDVFIWRTYQPNGRGGLFPLRHPYQDQRKVELWYQMSAYISEKLWG